MADLLPLKPPGAAPAEAALPYRVELHEDAGGGSSVLLATGRSPALAFAAYYAAIREYLGQQITLRRGDQVIASTQAVKD